MVHVQDQIAKGSRLQIMERFVQYHVDHHIQLPNQQRFADNNTWDTLHGLYDHFQAIHRRDCPICSSTPST